MKARARCWETCFLRLVSMTSRHWGRFPTPSFAVPETADKTLQGWSQPFFILQLHWTWKISDELSHIISLIDEAVLPCPWIALSWNSSLVNSKSFLKYRCVALAGTAFYVPAPISQLLSTRTAWQHDSLKIKILEVKINISKHTYPCWTSMSGCFCKDLYRILIGSISEHHLWNNNKHQLGMLQSQAKTNKTWSRNWLTLLRKNSVKSSLDTVKTFLIA